MDKFKKATKKITAVAGAALMVSSAAFAAGLGDYPSNFVSGDEFMGSVVVGSAAMAADTTSAMSIINDLRNDFSGESQRVRISYSKTNGAGEEVSAVDSRDTLNFGETLESVNADLDDGATDVLEDSDLDSNDYTQELIVKNGEFDYKIFDDVTGEDEAKDGLYYPANTEFLQYILKFEDVIEDITDSDVQDDLIGEEMMIMGNEFTIVDIDNDKLTLIGGSNSIAIGETESQTVTVDGTSYELEVLNVGADEVLLTLNGETAAIDEYDVKDVAGVSVAVVELVEGSDHAKGYAQLTIGGQKVELTENGVKINDEDLDDVYPEYEIVVAFDDALVGLDNSSFEGMVITYKTDDNVVLGENDYLSDILFDAFQLKYMGLNDVDYSEFVLSSSNDEILITGNLFDGEEIPSEFRWATDNEPTAQLYLGSTSNRIYHSGSNWSINSSVGLITTGSFDAIELLNATAGTGPGDLLHLNISAASTDVRGTKFFSRVEDDEFYLYEITAVDDNDLEIDFKDLISGTSINAVDYDKVGSDLEFASGASVTSGVALGGSWTIMDLSTLGAAELYLENELTLNFANSEALAFSSSQNASITFSYNSDVDMDDSANEADTFTIEFQRATDEDDAIELSIAGNDFVSSDEVEKDSDFDVYVDHYGTMVIVDTDNKDDITIQVPDEEVQGSVHLIFGEVDSSSGSVIVDADMVEAKKEELMDDGYTITDEEEIESDEVEFDVTAPVLDTDVSGMDDMIVVGGPAVNRVAANLLGMAYPTYGTAAGVNMGEAVIRYFESSNSVLVYGYEAADTMAAASRLNSGGLSGNSVNVQ